jgi:hypothetical protein
MSLLDSFEQDFDVYDSWGSTMEWFFTVCHVIHHQFGLEHVPENWEYKPGFLDTELNPDDYHLIETYSFLDYPVTDLIELGEMLNKVAGELKEEGKDY